MRELTVTLPLPPVELSKNGRAHWAARNRLYQEHKLIARAEINRQLHSNHKPWRGPVSVEIRWAQWHRGHWPDFDNLIERLAFALDAAQDAELFVNDRQIRNQTVEWQKSIQEGVTVTFKEESKWPLTVTFRKESK